MVFRIRNFNTNDSSDVNRIALLAFNQYQQYYKNWEHISKNITNMSALSDQAELIVATSDDVIIGAVVYIPPGKPKNLFPTEWPVIRMLVVDPSYRGNGIGKALTQECILRAKRDASPLIALHTSPIMKIALKMYLDMGFVFERKVTPLYDVPYNIYVMHFSR